MRVLGRWRITAAIAVVIVLVAAVVAFRYVPRYLDASKAKDQVDNAAQTLTVESATTVVGTPKNPNGKLVVYAHGNGQTAESIWDADHSDLMAALLDAGYVVASADAGGNAWGNPDSVEDYVTLIRKVRRDRKISDVYVIGESMGGLPSLQLLNVEPVRAWVGLFPVTDAGTIADVERLRVGVEAAYANNPEGKNAVSPVVVNTLTVPMLILASPEDTTVPKAKNADALAERMRAKGVDVTVISTHGQHGDPSNFAPKPILEFFAAHA